MGAVVEGRLFSLRSGSAIIVPNGPDLMAFSSHGAHQVAYTAAMTIVPRRLDVLFKMQQGIRSVLAISDFDPGRLERLRSQPRGNLGRDNAFRAIV